MTIFTQSIIAMFGSADKPLGELIKDISDGKILPSVITVVILVALRIILLHIVAGQIEDLKRRYTFRRTISYTLTIIGFIIIGSIWGDAKESIMPFLGLLSAGLAIAMSDSISNLAGWLFITWKRPFEAGERIEIAGHKGDVIDIRAFMFTILEIGSERVDAEQSTGRVIHLPNGLVFKTAVVNYNQGFDCIWNEIGTLLTFESNWQKAKEILLNTVTKHAAQFAEDASKEYKAATKKFYIKSGKLSPIVYTSVEESGVKLIMRFVIKPRHKRGVEALIWEDLLIEFAKHNDIEFAYPTTRFFSTNPSSPKREETNES